MTLLRASAALLALAILSATGLAHAQERHGGGVDLPVLPLVVAAGGVVLVGAGGVFALRASSASEDARTTVEHVPAAQRAEDARSFTSTANLLFLAGGALLVVGGAWAAVELTGDHRRGGTALLIGPSSLALRSTFE